MCQIELTVRVPTAINIVKHSLKTFTHAFLTSFSLSHASRASTPAFVSDPLPHPNLSKAAIRNSLFNFSETLTHICGIPVLHGERKLINLFIHNINNIYHNTLFRKTEYWILVIQIQITIKLKYQLSDNGYWVSGMGTATLKQELEKKMLEIIAARDKVGDKAFNESRLLTPEEWAEMARLQARYENYAKILNKFCIPASEPLDEEWLEDVLY